jgi:hypothetical protein
MNEDPGTEYTGVTGPAGVPKYRPPSALTSSDKLRLMRLVGVMDPAALVSERVWNGEDRERTLRQKIGDVMEGNVGPDPE